jgi:hypothetical protein
MLRDLDGIVSPWAAASPFGLSAPDPPGPNETEPLAETGAKWLRLACTPEGDRVALIEACHEADVQVLGVLTYVAPARPAPTAEECAAFGEFVRATVTRYRTWTRHWEIAAGLAEPGTRRANTLPDAHLEWLRAGYAAAKGADPGCTVVGGSIPGEGLPYVERFLTLGGARCLDALALHLPPARLESPSEVARYATGLEQARALAQLHRRGLPLWVTEAGRPVSSWTGRPAAAAEAQAEHLVRQHVLTLAAGVERIFWHCFRDDGRCGLVQEDLTPRPTHAAYRTMTRLLEGTECGGPVSAPPGVWAASFTRRRQDTLVCWALGGPVEVELLGSGISRWTHTGQTARPADGPLRTVLGSAPLYVVGHNLALASR